MLAVTHAERQRGFNYFLYISELHIQIVHMHAVWI